MEEGWVRMGTEEKVFRKTNPVVVAPHDPAWAGLYGAEAEALRQVFGEEALAIYHAGSTAIPGIKAKPIIDLLVVVREIERVDALNEALAARGYEARGEFGIPGRRFFTRFEGELRTRNLHVFQAGHAEIERMLDFRDYLRAHPDEAQAYSRLKEELADRFREDIDSYVAGKSDFIRERIRRGKEWRAGKEARG